MCTDASLTISQTVRVSTVSSFEIPLRVNVMDLPCFILLHLRIITSTIGCAEKRCKHDSRRKNNNVFRLTSRTRATRTTKTTKVSSKQVSACDLHIRDMAHEGEGDSPRW